MKTKVSAIAVTKKTGGDLDHAGFQYLERETRLELATPTLARLCSTN